MSNNVQDWTRLIGTVGAGVMAGLQISAPLWSFPALFAAPLSPKGRLIWWSKFFDNGMASVLVLIPLSTASFLISAYYTPDPSPYPSSTFIQRKSRAILLASAGLMFGILPYTMAFLQPINSKLKATEKELIKSGEAKSTAVDTDSLIKRWLTLHNVRAVMSTTSLALAVAELVFNR
ncbi:hypothetical protein MNV49_000344 [Pseudohyphozyma bogoriensis]|nr:hypothetical protein MNV49_000344 [Pseudohyphozyma bogoriensis]